jgi:hypothetical protein
MHLNKPQATKYHFTRFLCSCSHRRVVLTFQNSLVNKLPQLFVVFCSAYEHSCYFSVSRALKEVKANSVVLTGRGGFNLVAAWAQLERPTAIRTLAAVCSMQKKLNIMWRENKPLVRSN